LVVILPVYKILRLECNPNCCNWNRSNQVLIAGSGESTVGLEAALREAAEDLGLGLEITRAGDKRVVRVLLPRNGELSPEAAEAIEDAYGGDVELFIRKTPAGDGEEHLKNCEEFKPDLVFLSGEAPFPLPAIRRGHPHVAMVGGELVRVVEIKP
jgi:hypothetical protein